MSEHYDITHGKYKQANNYWPFLMQIQSTGFCKLVNNNTPTYGAPTRERIIPTTERNTYCSWLLHSDMHLVFANNYQISSSWSTMRSCWIIYYHNNDIMLWNNMPCLPKTLYCTINEWTTKWPKSLTNLLYRLLYSMHNQVQLLTWTVQIIYTCYPWVLNEWHEEMSPTGLWCNTVHILYCSYTVYCQEELKWQSFPWTLECLLNILPLYLSLTMFKNKFCNQFKQCSLFIPFHTPYNLNSWSFKHSCIWNLFL